MRQIHIDENLDGQVLLGPAQQSLFLRCSMRGTTLEGDWRGSDFLRCDMTNADMLSMQERHCYWFGTTLTDATLPSTVGHMHPEPIAEIIRQQIRRVQDAFPSEKPLVREAFETVGRHVLDDKVRFSWADAAARIDAMGLNVQRVLKFFEVAFRDYPALAEHLRWLVRHLLGSDPDPGHMKLEATALFPGGVRVKVNALNLPPLDPLCRYELARWIEEQSGQAEYKVFVITIYPMRLWVMPTPDEWLEHPRSGY